MNLNYFESHGYKGDGSYYDIWIWLCKSGKFPFGVEMKSNLFYSPGLTGLFKDPSLVIASVIELIERENKLKSFGKDEEDWSFFS